MMKPAFVLAAAMLGAASVPALAQDANAPGLGEVVVTGSRTSARYAQQDRPVVGLRRQADAAVLQLEVSSDSRDEAAVAATRQIRFTPARRDGQFVDYPATIHVVFALS